MGGGGNECNEEAPDRMPHGVRQQHRTSVPDAAANAPRHSSDGKMLIVRVGRYSCIARVRGLDFICVSPVIL